MSDMLERPVIPVEGSGPLGDSINEDEELANLLASLAGDKISFADVPYAKPYSHHEKLTPLATKKILTSETDKDDDEESSENTEETPLSKFRKHLSRTLQAHGYDPEAADDAAIMLSELVGNVRLHGVSSGERYSGECRVLKHTCENDLGRAATRVTTFIEVINFSENPESSRQEKKRGEFEGGNGLDLVKKLAESHDGMIGKYRIITDKNGNETFVPKEADCGNFVVWAALRTELAPEPTPDPTEM